MPKKEEFDNKPLSRTEATLAADYLHGLGKPLKSGWITVWKKRPTEIAQEFNTPVSGLLEAIRRHPVAV